MAGKITFLLLLSLLSFVPENVQAQKVDSSEWLLLYYLPYDNNLSEYADTIITQLTEASQFPNVNIVLQLDNADTTGMLRYYFSEGTLHKEHISSENSSGSIELSNFFGWTNAHFYAPRTAVFFLDHGGRPDEIGQDLFPDSTFLKTRTIVTALKKFNKQRKKSIDLLYLQVCAKASLETLYEFRDISKYTLASQSLLGAPNYYYGDLLESLEKQPFIEGNTLGERIVDFEDSTMYSTLTCVNNSAFKKVRFHFRNYIREIDKRDDLAFTKTPIGVPYGVDYYFDLIDFLNVINSTEPSEIQARKALKEAIQNDLIEFVRISPMATDQGYCGVSIAALSKQRLEDFDHMRFYRDFWIHRLDLR